MSPDLKQSVEEWTDYLRFLLDDARGEEKDGVFLDFHNAVLLHRLLEKLGKG